MNRSKKITVALAILTLAVVLCGTLFGVSLYRKHRHSYALDIPAEISKIEIQGSKGTVLLTQTEDIDALRNIICPVKRVTHEESVHDAPINAEDVIMIDFYTDEGKTNKRVFVYERNSKCYIEQPYNGIYQISQEEFEKIGSYF